MALVELGRFGWIEAQLIVGRLESEGIPAIAFDGNASLLEGSSPFLRVRVMVDARDRLQAAAIIAEPA